MEYDFKATDKFNPAYLGFEEIKSGQGVIQEAIIGDIKYRLTQKISLMSNDNMIVYALSYQPPEYHIAFGSNGDGDNSMIVISRDTWEMVVDKLNYFITNSIDEYDIVAGQTIYNILLRQCKISKLLDM